LNNLMHQILLFPLVIHVDQHILNEALPMPMEIFILSISCAKVGMKLYSDLMPFTLYSL